MNKDELNKPQPRMAEAECQPQLKGDNVMLQKDEKEVKGNIGAINLLEFVENTRTRLDDLERKMDNTYKALKAHQVCLENVDEMLKKFRRLAGI